MRRALEPFRLWCLHTCCQTSALSTTPRRWLDVVTLRGNARGGCSRRGQSGVGATARRPGPAARPRGGIGGEEIGASGGGARHAGGAAAPALALTRSVAPPTQPGRGRAAASSAFSRRSDARRRARRRFDGSDQRPIRGCDRRNSHPPALFFGGASFGFSEEAFRLFGV